MKKYWLLFSWALLSVGLLNARPVDVERAKAVGQMFMGNHLQTRSEALDLQLAYTATTSRDEACFYVFNIGNEGFVIVSADDRFRPIVGYSDEGSFATENRSPELDYYLGNLIKTRTSRNVVLFEDTEAEWQSVMRNGKLISRNGGRGVDYICTTKWNQDSPYNLYSPEANGGPGGRCYAGCVATAMSQVMKRWNKPTQGSGSHSYYCYGYGQQTANYGATTYDWDNMPDRLGGASQEEIEAVALLMYHCAVAVDMMFSPNGSGAYSWDVPYAIRKYFSYSNQAKLRDRDDYSLFEWQDMLKASFDIGWPVYYSGYSESGGHAFVCDGYDDNDLFHFNWGWGGSSDGWFVIDEIDYAGGAAAIFNYVPTEVYEYMPMKPESFEVVSSGGLDFAATLSWTNPTQTVRGTQLDAIDQIVVTRDGKIIHTEDNVAPGANMTFTDHFMPTVVQYAVYAIAHNAIGLEAIEENVVLGPNCVWTLEMEAPEGQDWNGASITLQNAAGIVIGDYAPVGSKTVRNVEIPLGHVSFRFNKPKQPIEQMHFAVKDADGRTLVAFDGASADMTLGLFFVADNTCGAEKNRNVPQNLRAQRNDNTVTLQWDAENNPIDYYCIYRDHLLIAVTTTNQYVDDAADEGLHTYYVTTLNEQGESEPSNLCNIQTDCPCNPPLNLRFELANNNKIKLIWDAPENTAPTGYFVFRRAQGQEFKRIKSVVNTTYTDNLNNQHDDVFEYAVAAYYQADDCTSAYANANDNPEMYFVGVNKTIIPRYLVGETLDNSMKLQWENALTAESYNIYRNGELIAEGLTEPAYSDESITTQGTYNYTVTGKTGFLESNPSNEVMVDWGATIVESMENPSLSVYPNPTSGQLFLVEEGISQVVVLDLMGQEVMRLSAQDGQAHLNLSALPDGTYFIKAITPKGTLTQKVVKIQ